MRSAITSVSVTSACTNWAGEPRYRPHRPARLFDLPVRPLLSVAHWSARLVSERVFEHRAVACGHAFGRFLRPPPVAAGVTRGQGRPAALSVLPVRLASVRRTRPSVAVTSAVRPCRRLALTAIATGRGGGGLRGFHGGRHQARVGGNPPSQTCILTAPTGLFRDLRSHFAPSMPAPARRKQKAEAANPVGFRMTLQGFSDAPSPAIAAPSQVASARHGVVPDVQALGMARRSSGVAGWWRRRWPHLAWSGSSPGRGRGEGHRPRVDVVGIAAVGRCRRSRVVAAVRAAASIAAA
jgi:hypothetical protein